MVPIRNYVRSGSISGRFNKAPLDLSGLETPTSEHIASLHKLSLRNGQPEESTSGGGGGGGPGNYPPHLVAILGGVLASIFLILSVLMIYYYFKTKRLGRHPEDDE